MSYSVSESYSWLSVSPSSGTSTGEHDDITVTVNFSSFNSGETKTEPVYVTGAGETKTVSISATAEEATVPILNDITDTQIVDDNQATNTWCDHDGEADVSEDIDLKVRVQNNGNGIAFNVSGIISLPSNDLNCSNITTASVNFPNISPGSSVWNDGDFDIWIYCMPTGGDLDFTLTLNYENSSGDSYTSEIDFDVDVGEEPIPIIDDATLTLFGHRSSGSGSLSDLKLYKNSIYFNESGNCGDYTGSSWNEGGYGTIGGAWQPIYFDAIEIVENWMIDGGTNYGFSIKPQYTGDYYEFQVGMSEGGSSISPNLEINYHFPGGSGQYLDYNPDMDIRYWYCNGTENGCGNENSGSIQIGRMLYNCSNEIDEAKIYFEIRGSDF